jgi:iron complex transport system substrate-binding protein
MKRKPQKKTRIVSLAPSATSILCAIGAKGLLAGVTTWCADVAAVAGLPRVGDCWSGDVAEILALRPTLVIGSVPYKQEMVAKLLEQPFTFLAMNPRTLADVETDILMLGGLANRLREAEKLVSRMRKEFDAISKRTKTVKQRPRVYCEAWPNPRISSPSWVAELVRSAGGEMVLQAGRRVTEEEVAAVRPDVIVLAWAATGRNSNPEKTYSVESWKEIPAIRNKQVNVVRDELLNTPGPPLVKGARELFRILHGQKAR